MPIIRLSMKTIDKVDGGEDLKVLAELEFGDMAVAQEQGSVMLFDPFVFVVMCAQKCPQVHAKCLLTNLKIALLRRVIYWV